jgi:hypothetical protein
VKSLGWCGRKGEVRATRMMVRSGRKNSGKSGEASTTGGEVRVACTRWE